MEKSIAISTLSREFNMIVQVSCVSTVFALRSFLSLRHLSRTASNACSVGGVRLIPVFILISGAQNTFSSFPSLRFLPVSDFASLPDILEINIHFDFNLSGSVQNFR